MASESNISKPPKPKLRGVSHLLAAICAVPAMLLIVVHAREGALGGALVFGAALTLLLSVSALYHTPMWSPRIRMRLRRLDRSMIYVLIAGSYTPFCVAMGGWAVSALLPLVWGAAALGVVTTVVWYRAPRFVTAGLYLALGWCIVPFFGDLYRAVGLSAILLVGAGGLLYTVGALTYASKWPDPAPAVFGYHEIFHLFVIGAAACHYAAVWGAVG